MRQAAILDGATCSRLARKTQAGVLTIFWYPPVQRTASKLRRFMQTFSAPTIALWDWNWIYENRDGRTGGQTLLFTLQTGSFFCNTTTKGHDKAIACRGLLSCLAGESLVFGYLAVGMSRGRRNTLYISRTMDFLLGKRFLQNRINSQVRPPNPYSVSAIIMPICPSCTARVAFSSLSRQVKGSSS